MKTEAGTRYGKWVIQDVPTDKPHYVTCKCDCGTVRPVYGPLLTGGRSRSCGCPRKKHNMYKHPMYGSWKSMRRRCDKNLPDYENISYPEKWKDFPTFVKDAEKFRTRHRKGLTLDRTNLRLSYSDWNCDWQTKKQQSENRRNSVILHSRFGTYTTQDWFRILELLRGSKKKKGTIKTFKTALQYAGGDIDTLLLTVQKTDEQIQAHITEYRQQCEYDSLKKIGMTDAEIAAHRASAHCALDPFTNELVSA